MWSFLCQYEIATLFAHPYREKKSTLKPHSEDLAGMPGTGF